MRDLMIADVDSRGMGYFEGIFGEIDHLGSDFMLGDFSLDALPIAEPRPQPQNNAKTIVQAVVNRKVVRKGQKPPTIGVKKVFRKGITPESSIPIFDLTEKQKMGALVIGLAAIVILGTR